MTEAMSFPTRRDRVRAATMEEITATARRLLVEQGPEAASLRAIAREMGLTAPALYRYYKSREELLRHVIAQIFRELADGIQRAIDEADARYLAERGAEERARLTAKMIAACREFRRWALVNKEEFALLFAAPLPRIGDLGIEIVQQSVVEFAGAFYTLFIELWEALPFPAPRPPDVDLSVSAQFAQFREKLFSDAPDGAIVIFMHCWVLLYGAVSMEVFGHAAFTFCDPAPMFDLILADLARLVGLEYPLPPSR